MSATESLRFEDKAELANADHDSNATFDDDVTLEIKSNGGS